MTHNTMSLTERDLTITDFLLARIAEDEQAASAATTGPWSVAVRADGTPYGITQLDGYDDVVAPGDVNCMSYCYGGSSTVEISDPDWKHIAHFNPARMLAECKTKRAIVQWHAPVTLSGYLPSCQGCSEDCGREGAPYYPCRNVRQLADVYASHPDYDPAWVSDS